MNNILFIANSGDFICSDPISLISEKDWRESYVYSKFYNKLNYPTSTISFSKDDLLLLLNNSTSIQNKFLQQVGGAAYRKIFNYAHMHTNKCTFLDRLHKAILLYLESDFVTVDNNDDSWVIVNLSLQQLKNITNMSKEQAVKTLNKLEDEGKLKKNKNKKPGFRIYLPDRNLNL